MAAGRGFREFAFLAAGHEPYRYQTRLAEEGPVDVLRAPTGAGKTLAAVLPWLWRRRFHLDQKVQDATPRRLALVLPMRVLVEQTEGVIEGWLQALRAAGTYPLDDLLGPVVLRGGGGRPDRSWREHPELDLILVGTQDMLLSRALNRGYAVSRGVWPVDFALLNADTQWVFDEVQLMGPGLATSRQLQGLRRTLGTASPCTSTWMSATVDEEALVTFDNRDVGVVRGVEPEDRTGPLSSRLDAAKTIEEVHLPSKKTRDRDLARLLLDAHRANPPHARTLAVLNTVGRAQALFSELQRLRPAAATVLVHSRFRPVDRKAHLSTLLAEPAEAGVICVATQVVEAGVDVSAQVLYSEAAAWSSMVQRAGRCNRRGEVPDARVLWAEPPDAAPYEEQDVAGAVHALRGLEGGQVTPATMAELGPAPRMPVHAVLRRRDLVELFDTSPDLAGDDIDIGRFIREAGDLDLFLAWRDLDGRPLAPEEGRPSGDEFCPVPIGHVRRWLRERSGIWRHDHLLERWLPARPQDLRPGQELIVEASAGGYDPGMGWNASSRSRVTPIAAGDEPPEGLGADPESFTGRWVPLGEHLLDTEREARQLVQAVGWSGLTALHTRAVPIAARFHDLGKADDGFQEKLLSTVGKDERRRLADGGPWAKSAVGTGGRHPRRYFRHELASMLALVAAPPALDGAELDLVAYLVLAHHGKARLVVRSMPQELQELQEATRQGKRVTLGVVDGQTLGPVELDGGVFPQVSLDLSVTQMGEGRQGSSWTSRALALRDHPDLGPFRLAALEALVRLADWRASALGETR